MPKNKVLTVTFESPDEFISRVGKAMDEGIPLIQPKDVLIWASAEIYLQFMSGQRYAILAAIRQYAPNSVYQLAKILGRAQQNVAMDCKLMAGHGFLKFARPKAPRKSRAPRLAFDYEAVIVCLPSVTYKVDLGTAA